MRIQGGVLGLIGIVAIVILGSPASSATIPVVNASFETLPAGGLPLDSCGTGCFYSIDGIPGWTNGDVSGQFQSGVQVGNLAYFNSIPDGITVAYSNGGSIFQTVAATAQAGVTYTLQVDMGFRKDVPDPGSVALVVNGNTVFGTGAFLPGSGDWATYTAIYTATGADTGGLITILLDTPGAQGDWDNVRLTSTPLPATLPLFATGLSLMGLLGWRRKRKAAAIAFA